MTTIIVVATHTSTRRSMSAQTFVSIFLVTADTAKVILTVLLINSGFENFKINTIFINTHTKKSGSLKSLTLDLLLNSSIQFNYVTTLIC